MQYAPRRPTPPRAGNLIPAALRAAARAAAPWAAWPGCVPRRPGSPGRGGRSGTDRGTCRGTGAPAPEASVPETDADSGPPAAAPATEPVAPAPDRAPGLAGTPAAMGVLPGEGPVTGPATPELPGVREWSRPSRRPGGTHGPDGMRRSSRMAQTGALSRYTASERTSAVAARFAGGWPFGRIIGIGVVIVGLFSLLAIGVGGTALADLTTARNQVVNTLDPAAFHASQLEVDLLNQETGVRGYALSAQLPFLEPYQRGAGRAAAAGRQRCGHCSAACRPPRPISPWCCSGPPTGGSPTPCPRSTR